MTWESAFLVFLLFSQVLKVWIWVSAKACDGRPIDESYLTSMKRWILGDND